LPSRADDVPKSTWFSELFPSRGALVLALFVCVIAPVALVGVQIDRYPEFSPLDEAAHFDYVDRVSHGDLPRQGERLLESTLRELTCRGSALDSVKVPTFENPPEPARVPACTAEDLDPDRFPAGAYQYEAQQPPTYYALTVPLRWITQNVFRVRDELDATRAASIVWLVAGLLLAWGAGRIMGIDPLPLGAALLLLVAAPTVVFVTGTVSNDVTAVAAGALVALVAAIAYRRNGRAMPIAQFAAGFAATACKTTSLFAVVAVSALFAVGAISKRAYAERWTATLRRWFYDGGALLLGGVISAVLWAGIHRSIALIDPQDDPTWDVLRGVPLTVGLLLREAASLFEPLTGEVAVALVSSDSLGQDAQTPLYAALSFLVIGAALAGLFVSPRRWPHLLGLILVPVLYVGGLILGAGLMVSYRIDPGLTGRYALSLAPLLMLVLAASLAGKWPHRVLALFAAAVFVTTFVVMVS
jgi:hypothetical protein